MFVPPLAEGVVERGLGSGAVDEGLQTPGVVVGRADDGIAGHRFGLHSFSGVHPEASGNEALE